MVFEPGEREDLKRIFEQYAATGDKDLREQLVHRHLGLAEFLARRFRNRGEASEDLVQVALYGLLKAVDRFDPSRGLEFSTFATPTIVGELKRHFRDRSWSVRVPRRLQELHLGFAGLVSDLTQELGRSPTMTEIAERAGASEEEVLEAMEAGKAYRSASLDAPATREDSDSGSQFQLGEEDQALEGAEHRLFLSPLVATLPKREQMIVNLRFFHEMTQSQIAELLGISQMHVSRLLTRSLARLREQAGAETS
ncbi:MAG: RNA polymerase sigma factor SigF [Acidimicrobiia bacterium]